MFSYILSVGPFLDLIANRSQTDMLLRFCYFLQWPGRTPKSWQINFTDELGTEESNGLQMHTDPPKKTLQGCMSLKSWDTSRNLYHMPWSSELTEERLRGGLIAISKRSSEKEKCGNEADICRNPIAKFKLNICYFFCGVEGWQAGVIANFRVMLQGFFNRSCSPQTDGGRCLKI